MISKESLKAPNPWRGLGEKLDIDEKVYGKKILKSLTTIIEDWPGENTVVLPYEERHRRFVLAIAGYPEIDVGTRPLDWPLHMKSIEAFNVSKLLDDIVGIDEGTSLRSSILGRDQKLLSESPSKKKFMEAHEDCLKLLFARLRQIDANEHVVGNNKAIGNNKGEKFSYFTNEEASLLTCLHSSDNNRRNWWPELTNLKKFHNKKIPRAEDLVPERKPDLGLLKYGDPDFKKNKIKLENWKKKDVLIKECNKFRVQNTGDYVELVFQFHHVQTWLKKVVPNQENLDGTVQRFLRGASLILELITSEVRQRIVKKLGIGAISVDGGGRIIFLCPNDQTKYIKDTILEAKLEFLSIDSVARNNKRYETTVRYWSDACLKANQGLKLSCPDSKATKSDYDEWFRQIRSELPPISISESKQSDVEHDTINQIIDYFNNDLPTPFINKKEMKQQPSEKCLFCTGEDIDKKQGNSIDSIMGLGGLHSPNDNACPFHRLLYHLGHTHRIIDSTLRLPNGEINPNEKGDPRVVTAIAKLDGNSLGILFSERDDGNQVDIVFDRKRRRSFRFNAHWWGSFNGAIQDYGSGDRVTAWVTAGDDLIIAQYDFQSHPPSKYDNKLIQDTIEKFANNLSSGEMTRDLDNDYFLSFGAGLAVKRGSDRIFQQLIRATNLEKSAKNKWKTYMKKTEPKMLTRKSGEFVDFQEVKVDEDDFIPKTNSTLIRYPHSKHSPETKVIELHFFGKKPEEIAQITGLTVEKVEEILLENKAEEEFKKTDFKNWDEKLINEICNSFSMDPHSKPSLFSDLKRHYFICENNSKTLVVLPPKTKVNNDS
jgi:hypothetical protein